MEQHIGNVLDLVKPNDPVLLSQTKYFDFNDPPYDPKQLYADLKTTMIAHHGYGLSANQCGIPYSVFVFGDPSGQSDQIISVFNPYIVDYSNDLIRMEESCLSHKFLFTNVKRASTIKVRYANSDGIVDTIKLTGLSARIFQHEFDHLNGVNFKSLASQTEIERAAAKMKKYQRLLKSKGN